MKGRLASQSLSVPSRDAVARGRGSVAEWVDGLGWGWKERAVRGSKWAVVVRMSKLESIIWILESVVGRSR